LATISGQVGIPFPKYKPGANWGTNFLTLRNSQWRSWLNREHRCVVQAMAFAEPDKNTPKGNMMWRWFKRADGLPFCFAGISASPTRLK